MLLVDNRSSTDPYLNLALEEYLVRNVEVDEALLLLYFNSNCIVLGKNQNIWKEANIEYAREHKIDIARRITGGGTVYHDTGNLNFSLITKFNQRDLNSFGNLLNPVIKALSEYNIKAEINEKNDLEVKGYKITGTAQFTNRKKIISHGTLLINSDLENLGSALKPQFDKISSRAIISKRSAVRNISELNDDIEKEGLVLDIISAFKAKTEFVLTDEDWDKIYSLRDEKYKTFEWLFAKSSDCKIWHTVSGAEGEDLNVELTIEDGNIIEYRIHRQGSLLEHEKCRIAINTEMQTSSEYLSNALKQLKSKLY